MFLCVIKTILLVFSVYGMYSAILHMFEASDRRKFTQCVFIDADKISCIEEAVYTVFLRHPDTEIYIIYNDDTAVGDRKIISELCKKYDFIFSLEKSD